VAFFSYVSRDPLPTSSLAGDPLVRRLYGAPPNNCKWVAWKKRLVCGDELTANAASPPARPAQQQPSVRDRPGKRADNKSAEPSRLRKGPPTKIPRGSGTSGGDFTRGNVGGNGGNDQNDGGDPAFALLRCAGEPGPASVMALVPALAAEFRWTQVSRIRLHPTPAPQTPLQGVLPSPPSPNRFACISLSSLFFACPPPP